MKEQILYHLPASFPWRKQIHWFDSIDSTNTRAKEMAVFGAPHGTVLVADTQSTGRGRMGRSFQSPKNTGIYLSVILRPSCSTQEIMHLTCAVAVAACQAVERVCKLRPGIKWTNDLVYNKKKLGGILTELSLNSRSQLVDYAVVGIGINCNGSPADLSEIAAAISDFTNRPVDRSALTAALLVALEQMSRQSQADLMAQYRKDCITLGRDICVIRGEDVKYGTALDIDFQGGLLVRYTDGTLETVQSGEVSIRGMYGYI